MPSAVAFRADRSKGDGLEGVARSRRPRVGRRGPGPPAKQQRATVRRKRPGRHGMLSVIRHRAERPARTRSKRLAKVARTNRGHARSHDSFVVDPLRLSSARRLRSPRAHEPAPWTIGRDRALAPAADRQAPHPRDAPPRPRPRRSSSEDIPLRAPADQREAGVARERFALPAWRSSLRDGPAAAQEAATRSPRRAPPWTEAFWRRGGGERQWRLP